MQYKNTKRSLYLLPSFRRWTLHCSFYSNEQRLKFHKISWTSCYRTFPAGVLGV